MHNLSQQKQNEEFTHVFPHASGVPARLFMKGRNLDKTAWEEQAVSFGIHNIKACLPTEEINYISELLNACVKNGVIASKEELTKYLSDIDDLGKVSETVNCLKGRLETINAERLMKDDKEISRKFESVFGYECSAHFGLHAEYKEVGDRSANNDKEFEFALRNSDVTSAFFCPIDIFSESVQECIKPLLCFICSEGHYTNAFNWGGYSDIDEIAQYLTEKELNSVLADTSSIQDMLNKCAEHLSEDDSTGILDHIENYYDVGTEDLLANDGVIDENTMSEIFVELKSSLEKHLAIQKTDKYMIGEVVSLESILKGCEYTLAIDKSLTEHDKKVLNSIINLVKIALPFYTPIEYDFDSFSDVTHMSCVQSIMISSEYSKLGEMIIQEHDEYAMQAGDYVDYKIELKNDRCYHATINLILSSYLIHYLADVVKEINDVVIGD